ncbi:MAG: FHA domain-containing serine/threonine-protein kinase [Nannocystaceae bacterium]|nr:protein kinase [Myxococcales bacterium]
MGSCPYRRIRSLGEGAVGDVQLAVDVTSRRLLVVKWLRAELHEGSQAAIRFRYEAERMAGAHFHGVIKVEEWGVDEYGRTWMAMEFVDGLSPADVIGTGDGWSVHRLLRGVGAGLDELHGLGIVHRDLKPENLLLRESVEGWDPVIIDLGIAKWLAQDTATATGSVFGTPYYMSPEQFRDTKHVGPATDRYALAVIAFELLAGRRPFEGRTIPELLRQHLESAIPTLRIPRRLHAGVLHGGKVRSFHETPRLDAFMARAMAKDPGDRYSGSTEMAQAFADAARADGMFTPAEPMPLFEPLRAPIAEVTVDDAVARYDLRDGPVLFGRHEACQVVLAVPRLSRVHAAIYVHRGRLWVADLHSQNGSEFQGRPLVAGTPVALPTDGSAMVLTLYNKRVTVRMLPG